MKNSALAPILLLLALLVLAWGGLFGLSHATSDRAGAARAHPTTTATPSSQATTGTGLGDNAARNRADDPARITAARDTGYAPGASGGHVSAASDHTTSHDAATSRVASDHTTTAAGSGTHDGFQGFLDRVSYHESTAPAANGSDGSSALSGRGAAALIIVLLLIAAGSRK